jgi:two-component system LytT family response regulator
MNKTILIADGESRYRELIRQHINSRPGFRVVGECRNRCETIRYVNALEPDVLFLDIQLSEANDTDFLQTTSHLPKVIYTAAIDNGVSQLANRRDSAFLLKPYNDKQLDTALQVVNTVPAFEGLPNTAVLWTDCPKSILAEEGGRLKRVSLRDICYLKAAGDYTVIHCATKQYLSSAGIGAIERRLDPSLFVRVHRSFIINIEHLDACYRDIGRWYLTMEDGQQINVGRRYQENIKQLIL